jgi:hypothetical protein
MANKYQSGVTSPMMTRSSLKVEPKTNATTTTRQLHSGGGVGTTTTSPASLSNFFRTVDRNFYFQQEMKLKDTVKPAGHYKPSFDLVDPRVHNVVKYDIEEIKEDIIDSAGVRQRARDITCCNRVLRVMEK